MKWIFFYYYYRPLKVNPELFNDIWRNFARQSSKNYNKILKSDRYWRRVFRAFKQPPCYIGIRDRDVNCVRLLTRNRGGGCGTAVVGKLSTAIVMLSYLCRRPAFHYRYIDRRKTIIQTPVNSVTAPHPEPGEGNPAGLGDLVAIGRDGVHTNWQKCVMPRHERRL